MSTRTYGGQIWTAIAVGVVFTGNSVPKYLANSATPNRGDQRIRGYSKGPRRISLPRHWMGVTANTCHAATELHPTGIGLGSEMIVTPRVSWPGIHTWKGECNANLNRSSLLFDLFARIVIVPSVAFVTRWLERTGIFDRIISRQWSWSRKATSETRGASG